MPTTNAKNKKVISLIESMGISKLLLRIRIYLENQVKSKNRHIPRRQRNFKMELQDVNLAQT